MMTNDNENCTFIELIQTYKVSIPIIQRDYAQGRKENIEICKNFLNVIKESLMSQNAINLDFVYGNIDKDEFKPLDGQQRLTTLFLLHWYAFMKEKKEDSSIRDMLAKFSYETRLSSRRFCDELVKKSVQFEKDKESIADLILDSEWFFLSWKQDSTIRSMLNTIDIIHSLFKNTDNLWNSLIEKKLITFHLLKLENFGLSDDLYIKMNARGKLLTPFENLKAEIQDKIQKNGWEKDKEEIEKFYHKIDTKWTDFLWNSFKQNNAVDNAHMNLISTLIMIKISIGGEIKATERTEIIKRLNENNFDRNLIQYIDEDVFMYICTIYDLYSELMKKNAVPSSGLVMWRHQPNGSLLSQILIGNTASYTHKVMLYAQIEYLIRNKTVVFEKYQDWIRVIRNIFSRGDVTVEGKRPDIIRSPEAFSGMINLVHELANGCDDIYKYLNSTSIVSSFAKEQVKEEILKAKIIINNPLQKTLIFKTEDNELLRGRITFALECAGYNGNMDSIDFKKLEEGQVVFEKYFNKDLDSDDSIDFDLLRRALLTIEVDGKYQFYDYWKSYWYAGEAEKRKLLPLYREIEYLINNAEYKTYFVKLVHKLITQDFKSIISTFKKPSDMKQWQYRLITEENLLKKCKSKYIAISEDLSCCYLLKSKRPPEIDGNLLIS